MSVIFIFCAFSVFFLVFVFTEEGVVGEIGCKMRDCCDCGEAVQYEKNVFRPQKS